MCWTQGAVWEQPDMEQDRAGAALPALFPPIPGWHFGRELKGKIPEVIPAAATSFCWDSNGAPGCPKAWVGLIPLLLINKGLSRAFICLLIPGFQTPSSFGALPGPATTRLCRGWMDEDGDSSGDSQVWAVATAQHIPTPGAAQQDHLLLLLGVPRVNCRCFLPSKHKLISGLQAVLLQGSCQSLMEADQDTCDTHHWELLQLYLCHSPETGEHRDCLRKTGNFRKGVLENAAKHLLSLSFP